MTVALNPFDRDQTGLVPIGSAYSVTLGKMLDAGRTVDDSHTVLPYLRAANIQDEGLRLGDVKEMPFSEDEAARLDLRRGDLLVVEGGAVGTSVVLDHDMPGWSFQKTVNRVRPTGDWSTRYLGYVLRAYRDAGVIDLICNGSTIAHLTAEKLRALRIPSAQADEQRAIADYLDFETARIDTLIDEQQRLIKMLRERRMDLIRVSVLGTRNPIELLAGRGVVAIGFHCSVTLGKMLDAGKAPRVGDIELPYIRAANIQDSGLNLSNVNTMPYSSVEAMKLNLLAGDLLVVEGGAVGTNVVVAEDMAGWSFQKTVNRVRPLTGWSAAWLGYVLRTYRDLGVFEIICQGSTIPHLTAEKLRGLRVPDVGPEEQCRIAAYLEEETAKIDELIAETERFIELSKERRAALIAAAVTGQIDVRETA